MFIIIPSAEFMFVVRILIDIFQLVSNKLSTPPRSGVIKSQSKGCYYSLVQYQP